MRQALVKFAEEPARFNSERDTAAMAEYVIKSAVNTHRNEVWTEMVTVDRFDRKPKFKNATQSQQEVHSQVKVCKKNEDKSGFTWEEQQPQHESAAHSQQWFLDASVLNVKEDDAFGKKYTYVGPDTDNWEKDHLGRGIVFTNSGLEIH